MKFTENDLQLVLCALLILIMGIMVLGGPITDLATYLNPA